MDRIELTDNDLFLQSLKSTSDVLNHARREIDAQFGEGFARQNPALVGQFMVSAVADFGIGVLAKRIELIADRIDRLE